MMKGWTELTAVEKGSLLGKNKTRTNEANEHYYNYNITRLSITTFFKLMGRSPKPFCCVRESFQGDCCSYCLCAMYALFYINNMNGRGPDAEPWGTPHVFILPSAKSGPTLGKRLVCIGSCISSGVFLSGSVRDSFLDVIQYFPCIFPPFVIYCYLPFLLS